MAFDMVCAMAALLVFSWATEKVALLGFGQVA
jgi:hypothetical protein